MNANSPALRLRALRKSFGRPAVDGLDLTVRRGELYALLGPNGAGKTTTLRMVTGLLAPDAGDIDVLGVDLARDPGEAKRGMRPRTLAFAERVRRAGSREFRPRRPSGNCRA